ncbi:DUF397 domain-containing protein [Embleya sp. NBC_00896]|uniref:DUF397 domain-containing protein n=1 Tax=Embleya sp. NBC_00896 TaxID=2975961 RepID=UPI0038671D2F|nr:DUF397 domain-containing protein [Embleya sp. NBC_00896]
MNTTDLAWFKSSYSSGGDGDCVEVAHARQVDRRVHTVHVRDSKVEQGPELSLRPDAWSGFLRLADRRGAP